jgi:hypothetical protein
MFLTLGWCEPINKNVVFQSRILENPACRIKRLMLYSSLSTADGPIVSVTTIYNMYLGYPMVFSDLTFDLKVKVKRVTEKLNLSNVLKYCRQSFHSFRVCSWRCPEDLFQLSHSSVIRILQDQGSGFWKSHFSGTAIVAARLSLSCVWFQRVHHRCITV